jgi:hypothetical protein
MDLCHVRTIVMTNVTKEPDDHDPALWNIVYNAARGCVAAGEALRQIALIFNVDHSTTYRLKTRHATEV